MPHPVVDDGILVGVYGIVHSILPVETQGSGVELSFECFFHNVQELDELGEYDNSHCLALISEGTVDLQIVLPSPLKE